MQGGQRKTPTTSICDRPLQGVLLTIGLQSYLSLTSNKLRIYLVTFICFFICYKHSVYLYHSYVLLAGWFVVFNSFYICYSTGIWVIEHCIWRHDRDIIKVTEGGCGSTRLMDNLEDYEYPSGRASVDRTRSLVVRKLFYACLRLRPSSQPPCVC